MPRRTKTLPAQLNDKLWKFLEEVTPFEFVYKSIDLYRGKEPTFSDPDFTIFLGQLGTFYSWKEVGPLADDIEALPYDPI